MSNQYSFTESNNYKTENILNSAVLVEDGIVWDQDEMQVSLNYTNDPNNSLTENNEHYLTANDTHYFSVLENSNETILHDLNDITTVCSNSDNTSEVTDHSLIANMCTIGGEPEIYQIEGTDELYAYEVAYDQEGNAQKFRYKLRPNENGEYESIPESIELVLEDDGKQVAETEPEPETELPEIENEPEYAEEEEEEEAEENDVLPFTNPYKFCIKQEYVQEDILTDMYDNLNESNSTTYSNDNLQVNEDVETKICSKEDIQAHIQTNPSVIKPKLLPVNKLEVEEKNSRFNGNLFVEVNRGALSVNNKVQDPKLNTHHFKETGALSNENLNIEHSESTLKNFETKANTQIKDNPTIVNSTLVLESKNSPKMIVPDMDDVSQHSSLENSYSENSEEQFQNQENIEYVEETNDNESDADEFQIVDGIHVTADTDTHEDLHQTLEAAMQKEQPVHEILSIQHQIPVLQSSINDSKIRNMVNKSINRTNKNLMYYVVQHAEKENLATINPDVTTNKVIKANPRSVLKSSFICIDQTQEETPQAQKIEKKAIKSTEAYQARILHNIIAKTTIIHAPVRQQRLPRKQTIKPVERADEEIIVQEMVVSSNGFIQTSENEIQKSKISLKPTEIVHLSDSDDDYDPKNEHKRKKKTKKRKSKITEIIISDSEDESSDANIVHIDLSTDSDQEKDCENENSYSEVNETNSNLSSVKDHASKFKHNVQETSLKKKRGRPPKRRNSITEESSITDESSSSKKQRRSTNDSIESSDGFENKIDKRTTTIDSKIQKIITKWKCKKCPKIFPSQGSLKTHMQYHNFHETKAKDGINKSNDKNKIKNIYQCSICKEMCKNNFLLSKHIEQHKSTKNFECTVCKKLFMNKSQLLNHKRIHIKEQMFKQTTLPKHSPKHNSFKYPKKIDSVKCAICTKLFTSSQLLTAHLKIHKRFTCSTCANSFISKLALEEHVRLSCVKQLKLSRQSISCSSKKRSLTLRKRTNEINNASSFSTNSVLTPNNKRQNVDNKSASLKCDSCTKMFITHTAMFKHKVIAHGLETPDKNIKKNVCNTTLYKRKGKHCSVPAGEKLRNAFSLMKTLSNIEKQ